jgi:hypothetical protein
MTAILLAMKLIVTLGPQATGQTLLSKKMESVPKVFVTSLSDGAFTMKNSIAMLWSYWKEMNGIVSGPLTARGYCSRQLP